MGRRDEVRSPVTTHPHFPTTAMDKTVVAFTEEGQVVQVGWPAEDPENNVVTL
ncbi:MAG: hypothetical protein JWQ81_3893, partial [Amycolatopsis sp.]|nr:hypothetical protein [Amycolatopsis sp.]